MGKRASKTVSTKPPAAMPRRSIYLFIAAALLSLVGLADAIYLTVKHLTGGIVHCTLTSGCEQVLNSTYATNLGFPLAGAGALSYFCAVSLATLAIFGHQLARLLLIYLVGLML